MIPSISGWSVGKDLGHENLESESVTCCSKKDCSRGIEVGLVECL